MGFAQLLMAMVSPLVARVFLALGLSMVSFVGMDLLMNQVIAHAQNAWAGLPAGILQLAGLAGIGQALGIIMGAVLTRVMIWQLSRSTRILSSGS
jgi:hypothetical protein